MALKADYESLLVQLLPPGRAFDGPRLRRFVSSFAAELARIHERAHQLTEDEIPYEPRELLIEWERLLGIQTVQLTGHGRQGLVRGRLSAVGGQSAAHYPALIKRATGADVTIATFQPTLAGFPVGSPLFGIGWRHVWEIRDVPPEHLATVAALVGPSAAAHTVVLFRAKESQHV